MSSPAVRRVFFYGLYMDPLVREELGAAPSPDEIVILPDYRCLVGNRATIERSEGGEVWGTVSELDEASIAALYPETSYGAYRPQVVSCRTPDGEAVAATAFVCPAGEVGAFNPDYARKLVELCERLGFPRSYSDELSQAAAARRG